MSWKQLGEIFRERRWQYFLWGLANLGGILVAYLACFTIWFTHDEVSKYLPGPESFLITGTISLAIAGVSYLTIPVSSAQLNRFLSVVWPFPLALIFGFLVATGMKTATLGTSTIWISSLVLFAMCFAWSSVTWLHEQGVRRDLDGKTQAPPEQSQALQRVAEGLPKLSGTQSLTEE